MAVVVALLRGVNVSGSNRVPMAALREAVEACGGVSPRTYLNSGNVVFSTCDQPTPAMATVLRAAIQERTAVSVPVVLRSAEALRRALAASPFDGGAIEPKFVHIAFGSSTPAADGLELLSRHVPSDRFAPDRFALIGSDVHLAFESGSGRSKMTIDVFEKRLGVSLTARNILTVRALIDLAVEQPG